MTSGQPRVRHELKYIIPAEKADEIRNYIKIPCYTVYDSIGVPASLAHQAEEIFNEELEAFLGFPLKVKTDSPHLDIPCLISA